VYIPRAFGHQTEFFDAIGQVVMPPGVLSVTPTLGTDWDGDEAVFLQIIFADNAVPRPELLAFTKQISRSIMLQVRPLEDWGVRPYFNFLTQSEQAKMKEPAWA